MEIKNGEGRVIHTGDASNRFCDLDLRTAVFEGMVLQGAHFDGSNLEGANFRGADLYWGTSFWPISLKPTLKEHSFKALT
jgi:uncharacterized protein YjbI with pentapeptide repeats